MIIGTWWTYALVATFFTCVGALVATCFMAASDADDVLDRLDPEREAEWQRRVDAALDIDGGALEQRGEMVARFRKLQH